MPALTGSSSPPSVGSANVMSIVGSNVSGSLLIAVIGLFSCDDESDWLLELDSLESDWLSFESLLSKEESSLSSDSLDSLDDLDDLVPYLILYWFSSDSSLLSKAYIKCS